MAAVTQTVTNYLGGVSNQPDDKKLPGQVTQAINAYPDPTFGLTKRPGFKFIKELASGIPTGGTAYDNADLDNGKWFYYNRDSDEKYIGCIVGVSSGSYGEIHIWNAVSGNKCTVNYGTNARDYLGKKESDDAVASVLASDYDFITIQDTSIIVNKNRVVAENTVVTDTITNRNATVRCHLVEYGALYAVTIKVGSGSPVTVGVNTRSGDVFTNAADTESDTVTGGGKLDAAEILAALKTLIDAESISNLNTLVIGNTLEIWHTSSDFTIQVEGGVAGDALTAYMGAVDNISYLSSVSKNGRKVKVQNTAGAFDTYWTQFVANDGTSGPGVWEETIAPGVSTGLNFSTMPHQLHNTAKDVFAFSRLDATTVADHTGHANGKTWTNRLVGDATTNAPPSFVGTTIQQSFYYNNRLGFLTADNVVLSQAGEYYNFYMITAQTASDADPIDISVSSTRPATLHGIIPTAGGLLLFSQNQQFIMFSTDGNLTPSTALIRGLSNYRMDKTIDPVDVGTHINFISKTHDTAGYTRVFGMLPQGAGQQPKVVDVGRVVAEYVPATVTALTASPQNSFIAMYGTSTDKIYFYRTYNDGEKDVMQTWFNWQCPGNTHFVEVDSDTMYAIIKTGADGAARYSLVSATMTQTPEETIIVTADGQQVNPHMDFYAATSAVSQYPIESVTVTAGGSGYSGTPTVTIAAPASGTQATATATVAGNAVTAITITNPGKGYDPANPPAVTFSGGGGSSATATANVYDGSYCQIPFTNLTTLEPVIIISGNATSNFSGTTESGFTITPDRVTVNSVNYYSVPRKDLSGQAANVYVGYKYSYDVTLPKIYFRKDPEGRITDYTASLTVSRCKFSIGKSSVVGFKLKRKGVQAATQSFTGDGSTVAFSPDFTVKDKSDVIVKVNGAKQILTTDYTIADHASNPDQVTITFGSAPSAAVTAANVTTPADDIEIYVDQWYTLTPTQEANYYLGDDVPIENQNTFVVPIHQKSDNYTLRVFSDSPFPLALTSMAWEGQYSPRYYRRT